MRSVKVLYLGRWWKDPAYHIEVESAAFLSGLKSMKELRLLSLQGISNINKLPRSIGRLKNLIIIDVKECHNLEALPEDVSFLNNLTYLDVSNCHILDRMPKGISSLKKLQVFKGFVITAEPSNNLGALDDLKELTELRKLSIIANSNHFPTVIDLEVLQRLGKLRILAIAWESKQGSHGTKGLTRTEETRLPALLPENLEKLSLQGFPKPKMPSWLVEAKLKSLKKLYIKGGMLKTLGNEPLESIETLCLKFLSDLKTDWKELQERFPSMVHLKKVKCPRVTFCPCDEDGYCYLV
ncbi:disease resistance RPP13-like protein 4 isoform X2 [Juglans microcarpa x Juglans regia]|uniref:disease resistance RPP13-like protein 4 isoform X2 n=1 Tax=Juglans microcarpa x Juglans regia TaxID=2249226 RepID=UPI001B7DE95E|nr:disease resistance RPP13-like protein 4 isoform X2 [Juglans microcarpa x Juglans regia]